MELLHHLFLFLIKMTSKTNEMSYYKSNCNEIGICKLKSPGEGSFVKYICKIFRKTNIYYARCQGIRNLSFQGNFTNVLNE